MISTPRPSQSLQVASSLQRGQSVHSDAPDKDADTVDGLLDLDVNFHPFDHEQRQLLSTARIDPEKSPLSGLNDLGSTLETKPRLSVVLYACVLMLKNFRGVRTICCEPLFLFI